MSNKTNVNVFSESPTIINISSSNNNTTILFEDDNNFSVSVSKAENSLITIQEEASAKVSIYEGGTSTSGSSTGVTSVDYLAGYYYTKYARKAEYAEITGQWYFNNYQGFGTDAPEANIHNTGDTILEGDLSVYGDLGSKSFQSGVTGSGWNYSADSGTLELDNLVVRKTMSVYEFVVNKIRATNGSLWVSDCGEITEVVVYEDYYRCYVSDDAGNTFIEDDIVRCQEYSVDNSSISGKYYIGKVIAYDANYFDIARPLIEGDSTPSVGDTVVRQGNSSDTDRQGVIYLTASDSNAPYIDVMDGVTGADYSDNVVVRIGRLDGISFNATALEGYGLYGENVYLIGAIQQTDGAWSLNEDGSGTLANGLIGWETDGSGFLGDQAVVWNTDGSGSLANGYITWTTDGTLTITGYATSTDLTSAQTTAAQAAANALAAANTAQEAAEDAQDDADSAMLLIDGVDDDDTISIVEKPTVNSTFDSLVTEQTEIQSEADEYGITDSTSSYYTSYYSLYTAYNSALSALETYLYTTLSPTIDNTTEKTVLNDDTNNSSGVVFSNMFQEVYSTRQALLNAISTIAKTIAEEADEAATAAQETADSKSTVYWDEDDPSDSWDESDYELHIGDIWYTTYDFSSDSDGSEEETMPYYWDGTEWVLDTTVIDGGRIYTGTITAEQINVENLFSTEITATNFTVQSGSVGNFVINSSLIGTCDNNTIILDPDNASIIIEDEESRTITIESGSLSTITNIVGNNASWENTDYERDYSDTDEITRATVNAYTDIDDLIESGTTYTHYILFPDFDVDGTTNAEISSTLDADCYAALEADSDTTYTFNIPVYFGFLHNGDTGDQSKPHKRTGTLIYYVTVGIYDSSGTLQSSTSTMSDTLSLDVTGTDTLEYYKKHRLQVVVPSGGDSYYIKVTYKVGGTMHYMKWQHHDFARDHYTAVNTAMDFGIETTDDLKISAAQGITEVKTNGIQIVWAEDRYFRIDGDDDSAFMRTSGTWVHNGYEIVTSSTIEAYVSEAGFVTQDNLDSGLVKLESASTEGYTGSESYQADLNANLSTALKYLEDFNTYDYTISGDWTFSENILFKGGWSSITRVEFGSTSSSSANPMVALYRPTGSSSRVYGWRFEGGNYTNSANMHLAYGGSAVYGDHSWTNYFTFTYDGKLGINLGTTAPSYNLDVSGSARITGVTALSSTLDVTGDTKISSMLTVGEYEWTDKGGGINLGTDGMQYGLSFYDGENGSSARIYKDSDDIFYVGVRGGATAYGLQIDEDGLVGVGCVPNTYRLKVSGTTYLSSTLGVGGKITGSSTITGTYLYTTSLSNTTPTSGYSKLDGYGIIGNRAAYYVTNAGGDIRLGTGTTHGATNIMTINSTGVGVFNTSPSYALDVTGTVRATDILYANSSIYLGGSIYGRDNSRIDILTNTTSGDSYSWINLKQTNLGMGSAYVNFYAGADGDSDYGDEIVRITTTGVGIFNTSPSYALDIVGQQRIVNSVDGAAALLLKSSSTSVNLSFVDGTDTTNSFMWSFVRSTSLLKLMYGTTTSADVYVKAVFDADGQLALGTTSAPSCTLDVTGNALITSTSVNTLMLTRSGGNPSILFNNSSGGDSSARIFGDVLLNGDYGGLLFRTCSDDSTYNSFVFTTDGLMGINTTAPSYNLHVVGDAYISSDLYSCGVLQGTSFTSGFAGSGWQLDPDDNDGVAFTVDKLTVRGTMNVYELVINQIRATNGSLWVSDAMKCDYASEYADYIYYIYIDDSDGDNLVPFEVGDIVKAQNFTGNNVILVKGEVTAIDDDLTYFTLDTTDYSATTADEDDLAGLTFVRVDNTSDEDRRGALYLTSSDDDAPYMDVVMGDGTGDYTSRLRVGKLDGVNSETGYGIWGSQDGSSTNFIISSDGYAKIAGWNFDEEDLYTAKYNSGSGGISITGGDEPSILAHKQQYYYVNLYYYSDDDWGLIGKQGSGTVAFQLGSTNTIAGWNFDGTYLYTSKYTVAAGLELKGGSTPRVLVHNGSGNYVNMYYSSSTSWGINGQYGGVSYFQLGSTNKIAGWSFNDEAIYTSNNSTYLSLGEAQQWSSNVYGLQVGTTSTDKIYLGEISGYYELGIQVDGEYIVQLGSRVNTIAGWTITSGTISADGIMLANADNSASDGAEIRISANGTGTGTSNYTRMYYNSTTDYGIEGVLDSEYTFRLGSTNMIAGFYFTEESIYSSNGNIELNSDGSFSFAGGYITGDVDGNLSVEGSLITGSIISSNWDDDTAGTKIDLDSGDFYIGGVNGVTISGTDGQIDFLADDDDKKVSIGKFEILGPTEIGGTSYDDVSLTTSAFSGTYNTTSLTGTAYYINSSNVLTTTTSNYKSITADVTYQLTLSGTLKFDYELPDDYSLQTSSSIATTAVVKVQIYSGGTLVKTATTSISNSTFSLNVVSKTFALSTSFESTSTTLKIVVTVYCTSAEYTLVYSSDGTSSDSTTESKVTEDGDYILQDGDVDITMSGCTLDVKTSTQQVDISTKGISVVSSEDNYFQVYNDADADLDSPNIISGGVWQHTGQAKFGGLILNTLRYGTTSTTSGTKAVDCSLYSCVSVLPSTSDVTLTFSNMEYGQIMVIVNRNDTSGANVYLPLMGDSDGITLGGGGTAVIMYVEGSFYNGSYSTSAAWVLVSNTDFTW